MVEELSFAVQEGKHAAASAVYLPYGTRTLRFAVTNATERPLKLWLRPKRTPSTYPDTLIHGYCDEDDDFWVHWAGGMEIGAAVRTREKSPLQDRSLKVWEVKPMEVEPGDTHPVFLNVTHRGGSLGRRTLTLRAITERGSLESPLDSTLAVRLELPQAVGGEAVDDPVRGVWSDDGTHLVFKGSQLPDYVSRWWQEEPIIYRPAGEVPDQLGLQLVDGRLTLTLDTGAGPVTLANVTDNDWRADQQLDLLRPIIPECFHFCDQRYYVVRLWFFWLDKSIGTGHEVPDAERVDILFDRYLDPEPVPALGTDFHYQETWGRLRAGHRSGDVRLGVALNSLSSLAATQLSHFLWKSRTANPARVVAEQLCGVVSWQTGPQAHVPLLANVNWLRHITSGDVREG